jgi:hypothetical protein
VIWQGQTYNREMELGKMNFDVEIKDTNENISTSGYNLSMPALVKHLALSGCHFMPNMQQFFRGIGMFLHYGYYLQKKSFDKNKFSKPPDCISDPTEQSQFSNLTGKAIADFLSKRIDNSMFTVNYEAAMKVIKLHIKRKRPDLLAFTTNSMFAIEAKGYSNSIKNMKKYIKQSQSGKISVAFYVASVSHNLYKKVKCKYYKSSPLSIYNNDVKKRILKELSKNYYSEFLKFMNENHSQNETEWFSDEEFYKIDLLYKYFEEYFETFPLKIWLKKILNFYKPKLIIPKNIRKYAEEGLPDNIEPFEFDNNNRNVYIDNDRIGIELNCNIGESFLEYFENLYA